MTSRNYCFTVNNPGEEKMDTSHDLIGYCVYQLEKGESGTLHYQGYVELNKSVRHAALRKLGGLWAKAHYEARQGTQQQAIEYCQKEDTREGGFSPVVFGQRSVVGKKRTAEEELGDLRETIKKGKTALDIAWDDPVLYRSYGQVIDKMEQRHRRTMTRGCLPHVFVIYGLAGTDKSRTCRDIDPQLWSRTLSDGFWWERYDGQEAILFDDYRCQDSFNNFLRYTDRHDIHVQKRNQKGGEPLLAKRIYITCPDHPDKWWPTVSGVKREQLNRRITKVFDSSQPGWEWELYQASKLPNEPNLHRDPNTFKPADASSSEA